MNFGRPAPGLNNVIDGLLKFADQYGFAEIYGFIGGLDGLAKGDHILIDWNNFKNYKNQGGGDYLGCSTKFLPLEGQGHLEEFEKIFKVLKNLHIDGLVICGSTHNLSSACYLAEYFLQKDSDIRVIGVPSSIGQNMHH